MLERFDRFEKGDRLSHGHMNRVSAVCEKVSHERGGGYKQKINACTGIGDPQPAPWQQGVFTITNLKISDTDTNDSGLYKGRYRWYSHYVSSQWETKNNDAERELDASEFDFDLHVGDKVVAYWDRQRGMFIPIRGVGERIYPLVDYQGYAAGPIAETTLDSSDLRFCLEIADSESGTWQVINDRIYVANGNVMLDGLRGAARVSGCGIYTFKIKGTKYLRVTVNSGMKFAMYVSSYQQSNILYVDIETEVIFTALRLELKAREAIEHSLGTALTPSTTVSGWTKEAEVQNGTAFAAQANGTITVTAPDSLPWTLECELAVTFEIHHERSSSSTSSSSSGSLTSSSSSITSSSSSSTSSTSSSSSVSITSSSSSSSTSSMSSSSSVSVTSSSSMTST